MTKFVALGFSGLTTVGDFIKEWRTKLPPPETFFLHLLKYWKMILIRFIDFDQLGLIL